MIPIVERITSISNLPVMIQANAGLPKIRDGKTVFDISVLRNFLKGLKLFFNLGVSIIGGCCGTTFDYIKEVKEKQLIIEV